MPKVNFYDKNDKLIETVEVPEDTSVMEAARFHSKNEYIPGIEAICGGSCVCGTCHIHVKENWLNKIEPLDDDTPERLILEVAENYDEKHSRCACQIILFNEHDGLEVKIP